MVCPSFMIVKYGAYDSSAHKKKIQKERLVSAYEFELYTQDCPGGVVINGEFYQAKKSCFTFTKPAQRQKMVLPYKCYYFNFYTQDEALTEVLDKLPEFGMMWNMEEAVKIFHEMLATESSSLPENRMFLQGCVCRLLSMLMKSRPLALENGADNALSHRKILQNVDRYIRDHYMEELTLADLADRCNLHPNYFHRLYTAAYGQTPTQRLLSFRIAAAKTALITTNLSMSEIAASCGFTSQTYFGYKFREVTGHTPLKYRKRMLGKR